MNLKTPLALIIGTVVSYFLGWLVFEKLLAVFFSTYSVHYVGLMKDHPILWAKVLGHLFWVILIIYVLGQSYNNRNLMSGLMVGLMVGFLINFSYDLFFYASWNLFAKRALVAHIAANTSISAITGAVIGLILKD